MEGSYCQQVVTFFFCLQLNSWPAPPLFGLLHYTCIDIRIKQEMGAKIVVPYSICAHMYVATIIFVSICIQCICVQFNKCTNV